MKGKWIVNSGKEQMSRQKKEKGDKSSTGMCNSSLAGLFSSLFYYITKSLALKLRCHEY
jgi:hypothetical protein